MSPLQEVPIELEKDVVVLDFPLPDMGELDTVLSQHLAKIKIVVPPQRSGKNS